MIHPCVMQSPRRVRGSFDWMQSPHVRRFAAPCRRASKAQDVDFLSAQFFLTILHATCQRAFLVGVHTVGRHELVHGLGKL